MQNSEYPEKNFQGMLEKLLLKKLKNVQKNIISSAPFKKFELSSSPIYNSAKTDPTTNTSFVCLENFKISLYHI